MTKKRSDEQGAGSPDIGFEKALARLETIVAEMEGGKLSLEDMMQRFEEGQGLVKVCASKLNQVERRIEILVKEGETVTAKPFEGEAGSAANNDEETPGGLPF